MAEASEEAPSKTEENNKTEFLNRVKKVKSDIKAKFQKLRTDLDGKESNILKQVEDIERDIIENYERSFITLKEINDIREQTLAILKSNETNDLLIQNLEIFNKKIEAIEEKSMIDSTIELAWKMGNLDLSGDICEVSVKRNRFPPPIPPTSQFTDRNPGNYGQNLDQYQNAGQMPPNFNFQNRGDPNYAPRSDQHYHTPPRIPLNSQLSDLTINLSRNPPSSESHSVFEPNYTSNPYQFRHNAPQMQSDYQFAEHTEYNQNYGKTKNQPRIPFPTQAPDRFATTSAFKNDATNDLYDTPDDPLPSPIHRYGNLPQACYEPFYDFMTTLTSDTQSSDQLPPPIHRYGNPTKAGTEYTHSITIEEMNKNEGKKGKISLETRGMDELLKLFFSIKEKKSFGPTVETGFPPELHEMAKKLIKSNKQEYLILPIYDIIILNLEKEKEIKNIMSGLYNLAKYPLCLFLDPERPEFHQIRTFSGFYTYELKEKLDRFEPILESFGYYLEGQTYKLDQNKLKDHNFPKTLATIGCELLLAYEELSVFDEMRKMIPGTIPTQHFKSQKKLQLSRRPSH